MKQFKIVNIDYQNHTCTMIDLETGQEIPCSTQGTIETDDRVIMPFNLEEIHTPISPWEWEKKEKKQKLYELLVEIGATLLGVIILIISSFVQKKVIIQYARIYYAAEILRAQLRDYMRIRKGPLFFVSQK